MTRRWVWCAVLLLAAAVYPLLAPRFWVEGVATESMILAIIGLSLTFLASYGGMVSLCQLTVAGTAGYGFAILSARAGLAAGDPWLWAVALAALLIGGLAALVIGALAVRTTGVYLLMLTMAVAVGFAAFARQNYEYMRGFDGYAGIVQPPLPGGASGPTAFYYLTLVLLMACYAGLTWVSRSRFGFALQAIRDDARRAESLGYRTDAHRIAAFGLAGAVAAVGGLLDVWYQGRIAPSSVDIGPTINILILCVLGGLYSLRGALVGALVFKLLTVFATDLVGAQYINLLTGSAFLLVTMFSTDGITGAVRHMTTRSSPLGRAPPEENRAASSTS